MINQLDEKTRIKLKYYFPSLGVCLLLQRKRWWGWKTVSWTYPTTHKGESCESIRTFLEWKENKTSTNPPTDREIGIEIMTRCCGKF